MSTDEDLSDPLNLKISRCNPETLKDELIDIYLEAYTEYPQYSYTNYEEIVDYFGWLTDKTCSEDGFLVASVSEEVMGFSATDPFWEMEEEKAGEILELVVSPRAQGLGLGKKLLTKSINIIRDHGRKLVGLEVGRFNYKAQALYKKFGFKLFERDEEWLRMVRKDWEIDDATTLEVKFPQKEKRLLTEPAIPILY